MSNHDPIEHVVVLMLENASFDRMLGSKKTQHSNLDGVDATSLFSNTDFFDKSKRFYQAPTSSRIMRLDPEHCVPNVLRQLDNNCGGFVSDFAQAYPQATDADKQEIMGYYVGDSLPALHRLATKFLICDHWYSSLPGPTWPNRFFIHSGTSLGHITMPDGILNPDLHWYDQPTIYERMSEANIRWAIYYTDIPQSLVMVNQWRYAGNYFQLEQFEKHANGPAENFPQYAFIEPGYFGASQDDGHPPSDVLRGERLIANVYNVLKGNQSLWEKTLLIIVYDEHGGFFDHVSPPAAVAPDSNTSDFAFNQYGVRVPAILVSPWVDEAVSNVVYDHTSILRYVSDKWNLPYLTMRVEEANSFEPLLTMRSTPRDDAPDILPVDALPNLYPSQLNANQKALLAFSHFLELELQGVGSLEEVANRTLRAANTLLDAGDVAVERFEKFLGLKRNAPPRTPTIVRARLI